MSRAQEQAILDAFASEYESLSPFREDRALALELRAEAEPVLEALLHVLEQLIPLDQAHEAFALVNLLGRRAALLGATPTAAVAVSRALSSAVAQGAGRRDEALCTRIALVTFEGYCGGRDELHARDSTNLLAASQVLIPIAPRCVCAFLSGRPEAERVATLFDEVGRLALRHDAVACLVDLMRLDVRHHDVVRAIFHGLATLVSVGALPVLHAPPSFLEAARPFLPVVPELKIHHEFSSALTATLEEAGHELKPRRRWPKDLFSRNRSAT